MNDFPSTDLLRIKKLKNLVNKNGFDYKLIKRNEKMCLYAQYNKIGRLIAFEVFRIKLNNPHPKSENDVKNFDKVEVFPADEEFGKRAWTYPTLELAEKAFHSK